MTCIARVSYTLGHGLFRSPFCTLQSPEGRKASRQRSRRENRRWRRGGAPISARGVDRRVASRLVSCRARAGRSDVRRDRPAGARLPCHRTLGDRTRHSHRSQSLEPAAPVLVLCAEGDDGALRIGIPSSPRTWAGGQRGAGTRHRLPNAAIEPSTPVTDRVSFVVQDHVFGIEDRGAGCRFAAEMGLRRR